MPCCSARLTERYAATNGVVIAAEKKMPNALIDESTVEKSALLSENVGVVYAGLAPDFRVLVRKGGAAELWALC